MATERSDKKNREQYTRQEVFIAENLGMDSSDDVLAERIDLGQLIYELDGEIKGNETYLFESDPVTLTPANMASYVERMIKRSHEIGYMATTMAPAWSRDALNSFMFDLERLIDLGDDRFRQNYVFFMRAYNAAMARNDMAAIADLFNGECPSLLRSIMNLRK